MWNSHARSHVSFCESVVAPYAAYTASARNGNRNAHTCDSLTSGDIFDIRTALSVSSIVRRETRQGLSDAWHVSGGPGAPLNRTPISNEYREESPCAPRMHNTAKGRGVEREAGISEAPPGTIRGRDNFLLPSRVAEGADFRRGSLDEHDQSRSTRNDCLALIIFACFRVAAACTLV